VIGTYVVDELMEGKARLGDTLRINGQVYTIVGIQKENSDSKENSTDDIVYIPYTNAARLTGSANISSLHLCYSRYG
jgi:putative ABC transport system permease protein